MLRERFLKFLAAYGLKVWAGATTIWLLPRADGKYETYWGSTYSEDDLPDLRVQNGGNVEVLSVTAEAWHRAKG